ncbi:MAG: Spx/MgsR family RNA polymerase-binding regulatory protein [Eubacterium sp.]|nr:Spx/MgsR family RNA polymerase-binding regulatory protein [Eubacterium sp.]
MLLYIIRHGETRLNAEGRLQGWVDEPLNENGRRLAVLSGEALKDVPFDLIITSPLSRARETGILVTKASARQRGREIPIIEDDRLKEINWGSWDQCGCRQDNYSVPVSMEVYNKFLVDAYGFEGSSDGESTADVIRRTGEFFQELIHNPEYEDKTILVSTHGFAMRAMLNPLYEDPTDFWQGHVPYNCTVNILKVENHIPHFLKEDAIFYDEALCIDPYKVIDEREEKGGISSMKVLFVEYPKCTTCKKAKKWLVDHNVDFEARHIVEQNPTEEELKLWHQMSGLPLKRFFNTSGQVYRQNNIKDRLPDMTQEEQYKLLATDGMLVKRPIIVGEDFVLAGFKEKEYEEKL